MINDQELPPIERIFGSRGKLKILILLSHEKEQNITAISRKTGLNHTRVKLHLEELQNYEIIDEKRFGRIRIYQINTSEVAGYKIKQFLNSWINSNGDKDSLRFNNQYR